MLIRFQKYFLNVEVIDATALTTNTSGNFLITF